MLNHAISHGFKSGAAEQNYTGGDGASNADPGIFEILCFFLQQWGTVRTLHLWKDLWRLSKQKIEKQNELGAKFTDNKDTKPIKKWEQDLIENLHYVL